MNILSVISSTKLKEINIKGFNGFFTLNNLYYSTNLTLFSTPIAQLLDRKLQNVKRISN